MIASLFMMEAHQQLRIRDAVLDDAEAIAGVLNPLIVAGTSTALDTVFTVADERDYIAGLHERGIFHVAVLEQGGRIVGCQSVEPFGTGTHAFDHVGVMGTYVDRAFQRQGIGRRLFSASFERARQKGYEKIFTYVRADNTAGMAAYLAQGFRVVGTAERHAKIKGRYIDEVLIERFL